MDYAGALRSDFDPRRSPRLAVMGGWYTIGLALGLGLGVGVLLASFLAAKGPGTALAALAGVAGGVALGVLVGDTPEIVAGALGALLGVATAAVVVRGAMRRGATRLGLGAYLGAIGIVLALLALVPVVGYLETALLPLLAARMRGREAQRFAGLRTLAK